MLSNSSLPERHDAYRIIAVMMLVVIGLGTAHNFLISYKTGAPALHPFSALGYLSVAISLLVQPLRPQAPPYWLRIMQLIVMTFMAQRLIETWVSVWPRVLTSDYVHQFNDLFHFNGQLSVKTAAAVLLLHVVLFLAPGSLGGAVVAFYAATCLAIFAMYEFGFGVLLFDGHFSIASLGAMIFGLAGISLSIRRHGLIRALYSRRSHGVGIRILLFAAIVVPFMGGVAFVESQGRQFGSILALQLLFSGFSALFVGLILLLGRQINSDAHHLERAAMRDALTGALSRHGLREKLPDAGRVGGVLLVDVDHFKQINDRFGHSVGDQVLGRLAETLMAILPRDHLVARWGGEEFLILSPDGQDKALSRLAVLVHRAIGALEPLNDGDLRFQVTVSIGYAPVGEEGEADIHIALGRADAALYAAKRLGRNQSCSAEEGVVIDRARLEDLVA